MKKLFNKRRSLFLTQNSKYLRYVFNDHFVLVLMFLSGFLLYQYSQLLKDFPKTHWPIIMIVSIIILMLLAMGGIASYLEPADKQFLLIKEEAIKEIINSAKKRTYIFWLVIQTLFLVLISPILIKLGLSVFMITLLIFGLGIIKWLVITYKVKAFYNNQNLNWDAAINHEQERKQSILKFFSLFTNVKGISTSVKRRSFLDGILKLISKTPSRLWTNLFVRAFLRSSDYLGLTIRLVTLNILSVIFVNETYLALALAFVFNYLLLFQLLALGRHFDYQYMNQLYPVRLNAKASQLKGFLRVLSYAVTVIDIILIRELKPVILLIVLMLIVTEYYIPYKIKKMID
ncbi:ABC transporter permease [Streptococcus agalactiae]|uniref:ABC transporter permease n=1 Tax=Streptococcus agalactiae TaxID=1311 RepID=UPI0002BBF5FE|nr:ABC transporter permease [Streptococcus agalactiae]AIX04141.1 bacterial ABC transporter EcsB family protein [Streptococcus agalactiae CNCTC 10/84]EPT57123.1 multidrug ABC transporter permease [Streptococcus agalactiae CCUG 25532]EPT86855.1 multidrug ABC transporter permease [Streptococcus agalactiae BSU247]EPV22810.1 multidrug ABC transporter permease [Streptococcus agalactiae GB00640]EPW98614.1 multidrug ABC transporter permease [Streptococcus agalactiae MRI Z1-048]